MTTKMVETNDTLEETLLVSVLFYPVLGVGERECYYLGKDPLKEEHFT